ncbi:MAG: PqqD family protein [Bacteroidaceae bacterium]
MKIKKGFELRNVCGEQVIVATGIENIDFSKIVSLNETAAYLWNAVIDKNFSATDLQKALCSEYDVTSEQAFSDASTIIEEWKQEGLIE